MEASHIAEAADLLAEARKGGPALPGLPSHCRPRTAAEVNAIIDAVTERLDEDIGGWKITFLYRPREKPIRAPMFASRIFDSPALVPLSLTPSLRIEPEIAFRLLGDLPPRARPYRAAEVAEAVVACPALEMVDTRFDTSRRSLRQMLDDRATLLEAFSDHITTGAYVVGEGRADWQDFDFATLPVVMRSQGRVIVESVGGHAFTDPFLPCVVIANDRRHHDGLRAGQVLVTGSFTGFFQVEPDRPVTVEFDGFGAAEGTFVSDGASGLARRETAAAGSSRA